MSLSFFQSPFYLSACIFINIYSWVRPRARGVWGTLCKCSTLEWTVAERGCTWRGFTNSPSSSSECYCKDIKERWSEDIFFLRMKQKGLLKLSLSVTAENLIRNYCVFKHIESAHLGGEGRHSALRGLSLPCESSRPKTAKCTTRMTSPPSLSHTHLTA